jgi:hypothetical protein
MGRLQDQAGRGDIRAAYESGQRLIRRKNRVQEFAEEIPGPYRTSVSGDDCRRIPSHWTPIQSNKGRPPPPRSFRAVDSIDFPSSLLERLHTAALRLEQAHSAASSRSTHRGEGPEGRTRPRGGPELEQILQAAPKLLAHFRFAV